MNYKNLPQDNDKNFMSKPFVIGDCYTTANIPVYIPRTDVWTDKKGNRFCVCVHMCTQFQDYPVLNWGIKQICDGQKCKFGGLCSGAHIFKNGKYTRKTLILSREALQGFRITGDQGR